MLSTVSDDENIIVLAEITLAEVAAAFAARSRAPQGISTTRRQRILNRFLSDCRERYFVLKISRTIIDRAVMLTQNHQLRGYDAVQLASALENDTLFTDDDNDLPFTFIAADSDLLADAGAEGLETDNPLNHSTKTAEE